MHRRLAIHQRRTTAPLGHQTGDVVLDLGQGRDLWLGEGHVAHQPAHSLALLLCLRKVSSRICDKNNAL